MSCIIEHVKAAGKDQDAGRFCGSMPRLDRRVRRVGATGHLNREGRNLTVSIQGWNAFWRRGHRPCCRFPGLRCRSRQRAIQALAYQPTGQGQKDKQRDHFRGGVCFPLFRSQRNRRSHRNFGSRRSFSGPKLIQSLGNLEGILFSRHGGKSNNPQQLGQQFIQSFCQTGLGQLGIFK